MTGAGDDETREDVMDDRQRVIVTVDFAPEEEVDVQEFGKACAVKAFEFGAILDWTATDG